VTFPSNTYRVFTLLSLCSGIFLPYHATSYITYMLLSFKMNSALWREGDGCHSLNNSNSNFIITNQLNKLEIPIVNGLNPGVSVVRVV